MRLASAARAPGALGPLGLGVAAGGAARVAYAALKRYPPAGEKTWTRTNHRGEPVTLLEGPAVALGAVAVQLIYSERARSSDLIARVPIRNSGRARSDRLRADQAREILRRDFAIAVHQHDERSSEGLQDARERTDSDLQLDRERDRLDDQDELRRE